MVSTDDDNNIRFEKVNTSPNMPDQRWRTKRRQPPKTVTKQTFSDYRLGLVENLISQLENIDYLNQQNALRHVNHRDVRQYEPNLPTKKSAIDARLLVLVYP